MSGRGGGAIGRPRLSTHTRSVAPQGTVVSQELSNHPYREPRPLRFVQPFDARDILLMKSVLRRTPDSPRRSHRGALGLAYDDLYPLVAEQTEHGYSEIQCVWRFGDVEYGQRAS